MVKRENKIENEFFKISTRVKDKDIELSDYE